ncbi:MAG: O-antigen ligase family protein, partial [Candidatus Hydrogenedentes bacterium]|nr:O-antigen ligase family protein [Candidatus Hydrogenedentota bacterium]
MIVPGPDNPFFKIMRGLFYGWILVLVLALFPYTEDPATPVKLLISAFAAVLITGVWTLGMITRRVPWRPVGVSLYLLVAFLVVQCGAALFSDALVRSLHALLPWMIFGILAFHGQLLFAHTRHLRNLFRAIVGSVALSSIYGLLQYAGLDPFPWALRNVEEYRGLPATYGNPNFAGHALVIALVLCGGLAVEAWRRKKRRYELAACLVGGALLFTHLYLTHMRGGMVALALGALAVLVAARIHRRTKNTLLAWVFGVAVSGAIVIGGMLTVLFFAPHLNLDSSLQLRLHGYAGASALFLDHSISGIGPGNYAFHNTPYWSDFEALWYALEGKRNHHVHNEWLEIAVESGVGGRFLFIFLF